VIRVEVVSEYVNAKEMVPKHELLENIPLHVQELNCEKNVYELKDHIGERQ
jgi:hypothetical protein